MYSPEFGKYAGLFAFICLGPLAEAAAPEEQYAAAALDYGGEFGLEHRVYIETPAYADQTSADGWSYFIKPEFGWQSGNGAHQLRLVPYWRKDDTDTRRSHADIREAYWRWSGDQVQLLLGLQQIFWGVTESRHLVDVLNQTDLVEDIDGEEKLGQPMLQLSNQSQWGDISVFLLPYFRERSFPSANGRFRLPSAIDTDKTVYQSSRKRRHLDFAARYSHFIGDWDIGLHLFKGTSREPRFDLGQNFLVPVYDQISQLGLDLQYTRDAWLYKLEMLARQSRGDDFGAVVAGFEYTWFQFNTSGWDLGLLFEYLYDNRDSAQPPTPFDNDIFLGSRLVFNDIQDTTVLFGVIYDPETSEAFYNLEAQRRLGKSFKFECNARFIAGSDAGENLHSMERDDYIQLQISYHF